MFEAFLVDGDAISPQDENISYIMPRWDHYLQSLSYRNRETNTFNLPSYAKVDIAVDARELSGGEWLLQSTKGDAPFRVTTVSVIELSINNYNCYRAEPSLTSTVLEHPLST
ncbi:hypothetical protein PVK06_030415 [Gossypium arboreum]|uniref:Uncharacterized protein n=1 Tax=Gossypium arboreum TaxID=29729 RepID=A0ABR0NP58_GOSAR|nr:hypothetical protein PVK06_030415 [Gossypium arboreum]